MSLAQRKNVRLLAEFVPNNRNRMMYVSYKFAGFKEIDKNSNSVIFENDLTRIQSAPSYVNFQVID